MNKTISGITVLLLLIIASYNSHAQRKGIYLGTGIEYTVGGGIGTILTGVELNRHHIGVAYAQKISFSFNEYNPKAMFFGMTYQYTFYREEHLQLGGFLRAGFVDKKFLMLFPSLVIDYVVNDYIKINLLAGVRAQLPSYGMHVYFNLPLKKK